MLRAPTNPTHAPNLPFSTLTVANGECGLSRTSPESAPRVIPAPHRAEGPDPDPTLGPILGRGLSQAPEQAATWSGAERAQRQARCPDHRCPALKESGAKGCSMRGSGGLLTPPLLGLHLLPTGPCHPRGRCALRGRRPGSGVAVSRGRRTGAVSSCPSRGPSLLGMIRESPGLLAPTDQAGPLPDGHAYLPRQTHRKRQGHQPARNAHFH